MKRLFTTASAAVIGALAMSPNPALAAGNIASQPTYLETTINGAAGTWTGNDFNLEVGKYYIWEITSDGVLETLIQSPELFRNSWFNQLVINDKEIHTSGALYGIEFDAAGTISISFVPVRPGEFAITVPGFEDRLSGMFHVTGTSMATGATALPVAINGNNLTFSQTEFQLETGKAYRLELSSDGVEELGVVAPALWQNSWINQLVVDGIEVKVNGAPGSVEYDDEGTVEITFVPLRPGDYDFYAPGYEDRGLLGTFVVR